MNTNNAGTVATSKRPKGMLSFWRICFFVLVALCMSLGLLTGCAQSNANPSSSSSASQEADDLGSDSAGFVVEDTAVVDVDIDEE